MYHALRILIITGLFISAGCGKTTPTDTSKNPTPSPAQPSVPDTKQPQTLPTVQKPVVRKPIPGALASDELVKAYLADPAGTKEKYYEKQIVVEGVIVRETEDAPSTNLALKGAKDKSGKEVVLLCSFAYDSRDQVVKLKVGEKVAVRGNYAYFVEEKSKLCVDMCKLVE